MARTLLVATLLLLICSSGLIVLAQSSNTAAQSPASPGPRTSQSAPSRVQNPYAATNGPKAPDMVCFGHYPDWGIQFTNAEARYIGFNEPDQYFLGKFFWVPEDKLWSWHRANGMPASGGNELSAYIQQAACRDDELKTTFPYSVQVYMPQGDMVTGCCRKLKPGEAPIGKHGVPPSVAAPNTPNAPNAPNPPTQPRVPAGVPVEQ